MPGGAQEWLCGKDNIMNKQSNVIAALSYVTWVGFIVALIVRNRDDDYVAFHMNQALVINIIEMVGGFLAIIPILGSLVSGVISLAALALWCLGIYRALTWNDQPLPFIGDIHLIA